MLGNTNVPLYTGNGRNIKKKYAIFLCKKNHLSRAYCPVLTGITYMQTCAVRIKHKIFPTDTCRQDQQIEAVQLLNVTMCK